MTILRYEDCVDEYYKKTFDEYSKLSEEIGFVSSVKYQEGTKSAKLVPIKETFKNITEVELEVESCI